MKVYSLTETTGNGGCYGVYSSKEKATEVALGFIRDWGWDNAEETIWNGTSKYIYYGNDDRAGSFEICEHYLDDSNAP